MEPLGGTAVNRIMPRSGERDQLSEWGKRLAGKLLNMHQRSMTGAKEPGVGFFHLLVPKTSEVRVGTKLLFKSSRAIPMGWLLGSLAPWLLGSSAPPRGDQLHGNG